MTEALMQKYTRENCIKDGVDPTGKKWGIGKAPQGWGLYTIGIVGKDEDGNDKVERAKHYPNDTLAGMFTSQHVALSHLNAYLNMLWDANDLKVIKNDRKSNVKQEESLV